MPPLLHHAVGRDPLACRPGRYRDPRSQGRLEFRSASDRGIRIRSTEEQNHSCLRLPKPAAGTSCRPRPALRYRLSARMRPGARRICLPHKLSHSLASSAKTRGPFLFPAAPKRPPAPALRLWRAPAKEGPIKGGLSQSQSIRAGRLRGLQPRQLACRSSGAACFKQSASRDRPN